MGAAESRVDQPATRREDIVRATWAALAEDGASRLTIRRVATRAGVDPALIYHYFGSKRGLLDAAAAMPDQLERLLQEQRGPLERLRLLQTQPWATWVSAVLACVLDDRRSGGATLHQLLAAIDAQGALPPLSLLGFLVDRFLLHVWSLGPDPSSSFDRELLA